MTLMNTLIRRILPLVFATALCGSATAMPKAAEDEDAPVTSGANAARPKHSAVTPKPPVAAKTRSRAKPARAVKTTKASNAISSARPASKAKTSHTRK